MSVPMKVKTWTCTQQKIYPRDLPTPNTAGLYTHQSLVRKIKDIILSWPGWSCVGSQVAASGGMDGVDRWTTDAIITWGYSSSSWIVLRKTNAGGVGKHLDVLIRLNSGQACYWTLYWGTGGNYTGGSDTTRPTYSGAEYLETGVNYSLIRYSAYGTDVAFDGNLISMVTSDGSCGRILLMELNLCSSYLTFETIQDPIPELTHTFIVHFKIGTDTLNANTYVNFNDAAGARMYDATSPASWFPVYWSTEGYDAAMLGENIRYGHEVIGGPAFSYAFTPVGLVSSNAVVGKMGRPGSLFDIYFAPTHIPVGTTFPGDGTAQWVKLGDMLYPWDGSVISTVL